MLQFLYIINEGGDKIITTEDIKIDIMIDEGLGAGKINDENDKKQLNSPMSNSKNSKSKTNKT